MKWWAAALAPVLAACAGPLPKAEPPRSEAAIPRPVRCEEWPYVPRSACRKNWTLLVYMAADNDLEQQAIRDLLEMERPPGKDAPPAASTPGADVVVELDVRSIDGIFRLHMEDSREAQGGAGLCDLGATRTEVQSPVVVRLREEPIAPQRSLEKFLRWGIESYPSDKYAVIVWNHGWGYRPRGLSGQGIGGIALDESQGTILDIPSLRDALAAVSRQKLGGRPFDIYASDACLMQSAEVAAELSGVARYIVGAEQTETLGGLPYHRLVPFFNGSRVFAPATGCLGEDEACRAAAAFPLAMRASAGAGEGCSDDERERLRDAYSESALDAESVLRDLHPALHRLGAALSEWLRQDPWRTVDLREILKLEVPFALPRGMPAFGESERDIGVFITRLQELLSEEAESPEGQRLGAEIRSVQSALSRTVIRASFGSRYTQARFPGMAGISVWLPQSAGLFHARRAFYSASRLFAPPLGASGSAWEEWLMLVYPAPP